MIRVVIAGGAETADLAARALRDAGMEVIHAGTQREPTHLVDTALQEDADAIAITGTEAADDVRELLAARGAGDVPVLAFPAGIPAADIADHVRRIAKA